jgi:homoserine dehydrogenase
MKNKIAMIGFGTVGQGLCKILLDKEKELNDKYGFDWELVAIADIQKGSVYAPDGLDIKQCLEIVANNNNLDQYQSKSKVYKGWDAFKTITETNADIVCELSFTDVKTGQPATEHCQKAIENGKHVVTSNKGPAALFYPELKKLAKQNDVQFLIEGTVMSGTPVLNLVDGPLAGCRVSSIKGILNGTTNYMLSEMEGGMDYDTVLKKAQDLGYAEADPTGDVEGFDAMAKVIILSNVIMNSGITADDVYRDGITNITQQMIEEAKQEDSRWKLISTIESIGGETNASVKPEKLPLTHPLASVMGPTNALTFTTDLLGDVTIIGAGAGKIETGFSILTDILTIHRNN